MRERTSFREIELEREHVLDRESVREREKQSEIEYQRPTVTTVTDKESDRESSVRVCMRVSDWACVFVCV